MRTNPDGTLVPWDRGESNAHALGTPQRLTRRAKASDDLMQAAELIRNQQRRERRERAERASWHREEQAA